MRNIKSLILSLLIALLPVLSYAAQSASIGGFASSLMEPVGVLSDFINTMAIIIGVSFIFGGFAKYLQHRKNPLAVTMSSVVYLFLLGLILVSLPLAYKLVYDIPPYKI